MPPVDVKTTALNNQNRRGKERLDMRNRPAQHRFFSAAGQIIYFRDIIREVFEDFIKICKKWVAIKATHPIKMEFSKLLLHRLYFWSFLRQAHHYVVP